VAPPGAHATAAQDDGVTMRDVPAVAPAAAMGIEGTPAATAAARAPAAGEPAGTKETARAAAATRARARAAAGTVGRARAAAGTKETARAPGTGAGGPTRVRCGATRTSPRAAIATKGDTRLVRRAVTPLVANATVAVALRARIAPGRGLHRPRAARCGAALPEEAEATEGVTPAPGALETALVPASRTEGSPPVYVRGATTIRRLARDGRVGPRSWAAAATSVRVVLSAGLPRPGVTSGTHRPEVARQATGARSSSDRRTPSAASRWKGARPSANYWPPVAVM